MNSADPTSTTPVPTTTKRPAVETTKPVVFAMGTNHSALATTVGRSCTGEWRTMMLPGGVKEEDRLQDAARTRCKKARTVGRMMNSVCFLS